MVLHTIIAHPDRLPRICGIVGQRRRNEGRMRSCPVGALPGTPIGRLPRRDNCILCSDNIGRADEKTTAARPSRRGHRMDACVLGRSDRNATGRWISDRPGWHCRCRRGAMGIPRRPLKHCRRGTAGGLETRPAMKRSCSTKRSAMGNGQIELPLSHFLRSVARLSACRWNHRPARDVSLETCIRSKEIPFLEKDFLCLLSYFDDRIGLSD